MFSKSKSTDSKKVSDNSLNEIIEPKIDDISENVEQNIIKRNENSPPSLLSSDLFIKGNLTTNGDIQIEGGVEGNIKANLLTIGKEAKIKGELNTEELIVNGHVEKVLNSCKDLLV